MSAATQPRPVAGDTLPAIVASANRKSRNETITLPDGSMVLTREELAIFGDGDPVRGRREIRLMIANERDRPINEGACDRSQSASVRIASAKDEQAICDLLTLDVAENAEMVAPGNVDCIRETVRQALTKPSVVGLIDGPEGKPIAVVMLISVRWWWSNSFYFQEIPLFVHPDHRRAAHGKSLIAFQKWWVDEMTRGFGYRVYLLCGVLGTVRVRAKTAWYRGWFRQVGSAFLYPSPFTKGG